MGMCRKVEDAVGRSRADLYKASLFDNGRDVARRKTVAAALESFNNLMTKYPAHESILKPLVSGLKGTNESHIHGRCHVYYMNQVKTAGSGAPAAAARAKAAGDVTKQGGGGAPACFDNPPNRGAPTCTEFGNGIFWHVHVRSCTGKWPSVRPVLLRSRSLFAAYMPCVLA